MSQLSDSLLSAFADDELTVPVQYGAQPAVRGILEIDDQPLPTNEGEDVVGEVITLDLIPGQLTGLRRLTAITVDGADYKIQDFRRIEAGALVRLFLSTAIVEAP